MADVELGVEHADVADEMDDAEAAGLQRVGVRADHLGQLIAPGMLERSDREQLVVLARDLAEVAFDDVELVGEAAARDLGPRFLDLSRRRVDPGAERAVVLERVEQKAAPAGADVDEGLAGREPHLAAHVVHLVALRLLERRRALLPVGAGVHHRGQVEPQPIERLPEPVVEDRVRLRLRERAVREAPLVPAVAHADDRIRDEVAAAFEAGAERLGQVTFDVDIAVEVGFEQADVALQRDAPLRSRRPEDDRERRCRAVDHDFAVRKHDPKGNAGAGRDRAQHAHRPAPRGGVGVNRYFADFGPDEIVLHCSVLMRRFADAADKACPSVLRRDGLPVVGTARASAVSWRFPDSWLPDALHADCTSVLRQAVRMHPH